MAHDSKSCPYCGIRRLVSTILMETAYQVFIMDLNKADTLEEREKFSTVLAVTGADGMLYARKRAFGSDPTRWRTRVLN